MIQDGKRGPLFHQVVVRLYIPEAPVLTSRIQQASDEPSVRSNQTCLQSVHGLCDPC